MSTLLVLGLPAETSIEPSCGTLTALRAAIWCMGLDRSPATCLFYQSLQAFPVLISVSAAISSPEMGLTVPGTY